MKRFDSVRSLVGTYAAGLAATWSGVLPTPMTQDEAEQVTCRYELKFVTAEDAQADEPDGGKLPEAVDAFYIGGFGYAPANQLTPTPDSSSTDV